MRLFLIFCFSLFLYETGISQNESDLINILSSPPLDYLAALQQQSQHAIYYKTSDLETLTGQYSIEQATIEQALDRLTAGSTMSYLKYRDYAYLILPLKYVMDEVSLDYLKLLQNKDDIGFDGMTVGDINMSSPSGLATIAGTILDGQTQEPIIGATIKLADGSGTTTDYDGNYETTIALGVQIAEIEYIGYQSRRLKVKVLSDGNLDLDLYKEAISLEEIIITETAANDQIANAQISVDKLTAKEIKALPTFLGEADVVQSVLIQPGVSSVGEGAIGFNVRGGDVDQNLVVQDEALIFNTSHALGFFSTFNTDMIKGVNLYKSIIPAKYGGRLASVMEVEMKDGDFERFNLKGGIGAFSARATLEGPLVKDKVSFITGFRTSYSDWILGLATTADAKNSSASFYDFNARMTVKLSQKSSAILSYYKANDDFTLSDQFGFNYGTTMGQFIFKTLLGQRASSSTYIIYSDYLSNQSDIGSLFSSDFMNDINYIKFKEKIIINPSDKLKLELGLSSILYTINPGERIGTADGTEFLNKQLDEDKGLESAAYAEINIPLGDKINIAGGLRASYYNFLGPNTEFVYDGNPPYNTASIIDTISHSSGSIKNYSALEPRFSMRLALGETTSLKMGYSRTVQYVNQIFNSASPTPTSQWQLSNTNIEPNSSHNISLGIFKNYDNNNVESSITLFGRQIDQLFDYKNFAELTVNEHLETELLFGTGQAYGLEFSLKRKTGKVNGTFSYTYSRSLRQVAGLNRGDWYPSNYDKPHEASLILNYQPNQRNTATLNFTYAQGRPTTPPIGGFVTDSNAFVPVFAERNQFRIPDYQRIDFAYTLGQGYKTTSKFKMSWTFTIYNILGRKNAYSVFFRRGGFNLPEAYQLSILGNAFPALTLNFELL